MKVKSKMLKVKSASQKKKEFEHVKIRAYKLALRVLDLIELLPNKKAYWSLADQLLRAATSIGANIIEALSGSSRRDFIKFYQIALKSANETKFWLCLLRDSKKTNLKLTEDILQEVIEISKILAASLLTLKGRRRNF